MHHEPDAVFLVVDGLDGLVLAATTGLGIGSDQVVLGNSEPLATNTFDPELHLQVGRLGRRIIPHPLDHNQ